jgi:hypothetical protein
MGLQARVILTSKEDVIRAGRDTTTAQLARGKT